MDGRPSNARLGRPVGSTAQVPEGGDPRVSVVVGDRVRKEWVLGTFFAFAQTGGQVEEEHTAVDCYSI